MTPTAPLYIVTFEMQASRFSRLLLQHATTRVTGTYEMDMDRMTVANVAQDVLDGQYPDVRKVYAATPGQDCADITEDIATLVTVLARREGVAVDHGLRTWLHSVLGVESTRGLVEV